MEVVPIFDVVEKPKNYFALHRKLFRVVGISFSQTENKYYRIYSTIIIILAICVYPLIQLSDALKFHNNMDILSDILTFTSLMSMGLIKSMVIYINRRRIGKIMYEFENGMFYPNAKLGGKYEFDCIKKCIQNTNRMCVGFLGSVYITMVVGVADCILRRVTSNDHHKWKFPLGSFSLFDVTHSPNYEIACFLQIFLVTINFTSLMTTDVLISGILAHISTQYLLLQNRIKLMTKNAYCNLIAIQGMSEIKEKPPEPDRIPWKYLDEVLRETVSYHYKIINLTNNFESLFSYLMLIQFLSTSATLCFAMYYCSSLSVTDFKFFQYVVGAIDIAFQVLFYCYWGNEVALESQAVVQACYECDFVGTDLRFQKGLLTIMKRCQIPKVLTAGKFSTLCLTTFVWIIRASYSYFMVLRRLQ